MVVSMVREPSPLREMLALQALVKSSRAARRKEAFFENRFIRFSIFFLDYKTAIWKLREWEVNSV
jgi:hypothetical protein